MGILKVFENFCSELFVSKRLIRLATPLNPAAIRMSSSAIKLNSPTGVFKFVESNT
jgi:hypothetical protein